jgi:hypothetical protein
MQHLILTSLAVGLLCDSEKSAYVLQARPLVIPSKKKSGLYHVGLRLILTFRMKSESSIPSSP